MRRVLLAVIAGSQHGTSATYVSPSYTGSSTLQTRYTCAEAKEHEEIVFDCGGEVISKVSMASYGTPTGHCGNCGGPSGCTSLGDLHSVKSCNSRNSLSVLEDRCLGQTTCMFVVNDELFGGDPCMGKAKRMGAMLACGDHAAAEAAAKEAKAKRNRLGYGTRFLVLLFLVFALYCGLGVIYRVRRLGIKPGPEALPHLEMWKDLPHLVKDGIIFSVDTIKSKAAPNYQTVL